MEAEVVSGRSEVRLETRRIAGHATEGSPKAGLQPWREIIEPHEDHQLVRHTPFRVVPRSRLVRHRSWGDCFKQLRCCRRFPEVSPNRLRLRRRRSERQVDPMGAS